jgi:hypothetical protein
MMCSVIFLHIFCPSIFFFLKKFTIKLMKLTCRSHKFNNEFANLLYGDRQDMGI